MASKTGSGEGVKRRNYNDMVDLAAAEMFDCKELVALRCATGVCVCACVIS